ncbi:hypothetical protein [Tenacibaculum aiptasiae]|uniref:hypothetical protein n=1 Tax=Tenacibaculum aiptasiae TaxID=426481 RepID=UPI0023300868|nr:hypothetical protein [Tenacibaculum aiptasiae]
MKKAYKIIKNNIWGIVIISWLFALTFLCANQKPVRIQVTFSDASKKEFVVGYPVLDKGCIYDGSGVNLVVCCDVRTFKVIPNK